MGRYFHQRVIIWIFSLNNFKYSVKREVVALLDQGEDTAIFSGFPGFF